MILAIAMAAGLAAQPPADRPDLHPEVAYVVVGGGSPEAERALASLAETMDADDRLRMRPARIATARLRRCLDEREMVDRVNLCVRAQLPYRVGQPPVVALMVRVRRRSTVTGSSVIVNDDVQCVGRRSVGHIEFGGRLATIPERHREGARWEIANCIREALEVPARFAEERDGSVRLAMPYNLQLSQVRDANQARGITTERVRVAFLNRGEAVPRRRACRLRARVVEVESGERFHPGDMVELSAPCGGSVNRFTFDHVFETERLGPQGSARLYLNPHGQLFFVEPL